MDSVSVPVVFGLLNSEFSEEAFFDALYFSNSLFISSSKLVVGVIGRKLSVTEGVATILTSQSVSGRWVESAYNIFRCDFFKKLKLI